MNCTEPPLTTIRQPIEVVGRAAVELLCTGVEGGSLPPDELLFEPEAVVRGSTAQAPRRARTTGPSAAVGARQDRGARAAAAQWGTWTTST